MSRANKRILIVDGAPDLRRGLRIALSGLGFEISGAAKGEDVLSLVRTSNFDAVLLDMNMPGIGGLETCRRVRQFSARTPIIALSVGGSEDDTVQAFEAGADDYLIKPINPRELVARLRSLMRRAQEPEEAETPPVLVIGDIELDSERRLLLKAGKRIHLTPKEFDLLRFLMANAGKAISHERLLRAVWGAEYHGELEYLRTFMRQIRKKIEDNPGTPKYLLTDAHVGYRFSAEVKSRPVSKP